MEDLVNLVSKRAGITQAQSREAVQAMLEFLQKKLPEPVGGIVGTFLGKEGMLSQADDLLQGLGGLLGGLGGAEPARSPRKPAAGRRPAAQPSGTRRAKRPPKAKPGPKARPRPTGRKEPAKGPGPRARKKTGTG